jgi:hypothetical protein
MPPLQSLQPSLSSSTFHGQVHVAAGPRGTSEGRPATLSRKLGPERFSMGARSSICSRHSLLKIKLKFMCPLSCAFASSRYMLECLPDSPPQPPQPPQPPSASNHSLKGMEQLPGGPLPPPQPPSAGTRKRKLAREAKADVPPTPPKTARAGQPAPAAHDAAGTGLGRSLAQLQKEKQVGDFAGMVK